MTEQHESHTLRDLTDAQRLAIDALLTGATDKEAADSVGVKRETVNRWVNHHPAFRAELNRRRQHIQDQHSDQIRQMNGVALEHYHQRMLEGDADYIKSWVKASGVARLNTTVTGPLDSEDIIKDHVDRRRKRWEDEPTETDSDSWLFRTSHKYPSPSAIRWEVERELRDVTDCEPVEDDPEPGNIVFYMDDLEDEEPTRS